MIKRIKSLISVRNLTASQFADLLQVQRSSISHILSGRNKPSLDFVMKIIEQFPEVSLEWLMNGKGEMFSRPPINVPQNSLQLELAEEKSLEIEKNLPKTDVLDVQDSDVAENTDIISNDSPVNKDLDRDVKPVDSGLVNADSDEIEKILVLYKNGRFVAYKP